MVFEKIACSIASGEAEQTLELTRQALAQGYPPETVLKDGLIQGINVVAAKFREQRVVVPEVLMATRAMHAGLSLLEPHLKKYSGSGIAKFVLGTVAGDLHDIGLTLVKMMVMATGNHVVYLGVDVTPRKFASAVRKEKPHVLMMSSLLTTTMGAMKDVIDLLEAEDLRKGLTVIVGGTPVDENFAKKIGADYYFYDAFEVYSFIKKNLKNIVSKKRVIND